MIEKKKSNNIFRGGQPNDKDSKFTNSGNPQRNILKNPLNGKHCRLRGWPH